MPSHVVWPLRAAVPVAAAAMLLLGCSGSPGSGNGPGGEEGAAGSSTPPAPPQVVVAVGASDTVGVGVEDPQTQAWPNVLHETVLPTSTLVNVGVSGATVRDALDGQLPRALAAEPDVATVWLAVNDIASLVPVDTYEQQLRRLVHQLRRGGETDVLVGNVPALWELPAYRACLPASAVTDVECLLPWVPTETQVREIVGQYNAAIERVAEAEGAELVDLSARLDLEGLTSSDGFHPSARGHREIARAFGRVLAA